MKKILTSLLISITLFFISCGQTDNKIINELTPEHVHVPGTKVSMIPPAGFQTSPNFAGFQDLSTGSFIMVVEMPGSYYDASIGFTDQALRKQGLSVDQRNEITINGYAGLLIYASQQTVNGMYDKIILTFGDTSNTVIINGGTLINQGNTFSQIETAVLSTYFDKYMTIDPLAGLDFEVDISNTKFQFGHMMAGTVIYTADGKVPTESEDKSNISIGKSFSELEITDRRVFAMNRFLDLPIIDVLDTSSIKPVRIDRLEGYEIIAEVRDEKTMLPELVYQTMLFDGNEYYLIVGRSNQDYEKHIELFRQIANTFKRK